MNVSASHAPPPADLMSALALVCPEVRQDILTQWEEPVTAYAGRVFRPVSAPGSPIAIQARGMLRDVLHGRARATLDPGAVEPAMNAFDRHAVVQAGIHSQLLLDNITFYAFLLGWLGAVEVNIPAFFAFTGTTVTMETMGKEGPGWLDLGDQQINLFGMGRHKLCRQSACGAGPVTLNRKALEAAQSVHGSRALAVLLAHADRKWGNAADAVAALNGALVSSFQSDNPAQPVFFDDRHAALVVARHLDDENSFITRLLTDPLRRSRLQTSLDQAASGPFGRFIPLATELFWGVRDKRVRKLALAEGRLVEPERPNGLAVPLERAALRDALMNGTLLPNLFLLFLVMSLLPRVRVLGGFRQIGYVPVFQAVLRETLDSSFPEERGLAEELAVHENAWGMRVIEYPMPMLEQLRDAPEGQFLTSLRNRHMTVSLAESTDGLSLLQDSSRWRRLVRELRSPGTR